MENNTDPYLIDKLTTDDELSIFLRVLLRRLPRVLHNGITYNKSYDDIYHKYIEKTNLIKNFIDLCIDWDPTQTCSKNEVYENYRKYCIKNEIKIIESDQSFSRGMSKEGFNSKQIRTKDGREYHWIGIKLKNNI